VSAVLHGYFRSSAAFRARIALNLKGIAFTTVAHDLRAGAQREEAYLALNPAGLVPVLQIDGVALTQSLAICEYLDETRPDPPLLPADAVGRARVRALAQVCACDIHPINNLRVLRYLKARFGQDQPAIDEWYRHWIAEGFDALEEELRRSPRTGRFCDGDSPTLADVALIPQVWNALRSQIDVGAWPCISSVYEVALALPAFEAALPDRQPDAI
jgi:maleylacetoacetate isomerase